MPEASSVVTLVDSQLHFGRGASSDASKLLWFRLARCSIAQGFPAIASGQDGGFTRC